MTGEPPAPPIARRPAAAGLVLGVLSAVLAVWWKVALPLGAVAAGTAGVLLGLAGAFFGGDTADAPVVVNGIETSTPDSAHQPPLDLDPGGTCTVIATNGTAATTCRVSQIRRSP